MVLDIPNGGDKDDQGFFLRRDVRETAGISGAPVIGDFTSAQHDHTNAAAGGTVDHINITSIGTNSHSQIDVHIADLTLHFTEASIDHNSITNSHNLTTDIDHDQLLNFLATEHFLEGAINHANILNIGTNSHSQIDTFIGTAKVDSAVAGAGIDVSGATGNVTISAEDSTAGNKGIVIVTGGEGMDVSYASGNATISGENASTSNKGIASFSSADFNVSSGAVSLDDDTLKTLDGDSGTATGVGHSINILGTANEITTTGGSPTGDDLTIALANKTSYVSIPGVAFSVSDEATETAQRGADGSIAPADGVSTAFFAGIQIPHGAIVTAAIVHGAGARTWSLKRRELATGTSATLATASFETEDTSISNATINNLTYAYYFETSDASGDDVVGARVSYTTDYD